MAKRSILFSMLLMVVSGAVSQEDAFSFLVPEFFGPSDFITHCPLESTMIRGKDDCAWEGGGFKAQRKKGPHLALDLETIDPEGKVFAAASGKVALVGLEKNWKNLGNVVFIQHDDGSYFTLYGHLSEVLVKAGERVSGGQQIGTLGYSGNAKCLKDKGLRMHVHFAAFRSVASSDFPAARPITQWKQEGDALPSTFGVVGPLDTSARLRAIHECLY
ncbi:MAG: M23 family metallopeptidase [Pseudomonadota bacterium]